MEESGAGTTRKTMSGTGAGQCAGLGLQQISAQNYFKMSYVDAPTPVRNNKPLHSCRYVSGFLNQISVFFSNLLIFVITDVSTSQLKSVQVSTSQQSQLKSVVSVEVEVLFLNICLDFDKLLVFYCLYHFIAYIIKHTHICLDCLYTANKSICVKITVPHASFHQIKGLSKPS